MSDEKGGRQYPSTPKNLIEIIRSGGDGSADAKNVFVAWCYELARPYLASILKDEAEDATQEFFAKKDVKYLIEHYDPAKGGFRSFLKRCLHNHASDWLRRRLDQVEVEMDETTAAQFARAETFFHDENIRQIVHLALNILRDQCYADGLSQNYELFVAFRIEPELEGSARSTWRELGLRYGLDEKTAQERAETAAGRFRRIALSLADPEEWRFLCSQASTNLVRVLNFALWDRLHALRLAGGNPRGDSIRDGVREAFGEREGNDMLNAVCDLATKVAELKKIKDDCKKIASKDGSAARNDGAGTLYLAAIASALAFHGKDISSVPVKDRLPHFRRLSNELCGDPLAEVFQRAVDRLDGPGV